MKRLRLSRDAWLLVALLVLLAAFSGFIALRQAQLSQARQTFIPYSTHSAQPSGTLALYRWLEAMGYRPRRIENQAFRIDDDVRLLFVLAPLQEIDSRQAKYILDWVERGNSLYVADDNFPAVNGLLRSLEIDYDSGAAPARSALLDQPLVDSSLGELQAYAYAPLKPNRDDFVQYLASDGKPLLIRIPYGQGTIWASAAPNLLSNQQLRDKDNAKFAAAIAASVPHGSVIAFDEYHLGFQTESAGSLLDALYDTPWGWAILFSFFVIFGYLVVNGRRFGRVVPVQTTLALRTPSEYVVSMANLFRRANKRGMVLQHYRHSLKRRLGRPFHLSPELSDERYVELLARMRPDLDRAELARILNALRRSDASEAELVKTVEQAITFGARRKGSNS